jgi:hypothetical protein
MSTKTDMTFHRVPGKPCTYLVAGRWTVWTSTTYVNRSAIHGKQGWYRGGFRMTAWRVQDGLGNGARADVFYSRAEVVAYVRRQLELAILVDAARAS